MVNTMQQPPTLQARPSNLIAAILDGGAPLLASHPNDVPVALFVLGAAGEAMVSGVPLPDVVRAWLCAAPSRLFVEALDMAIVEAKGLVHYADVLHDDGAAVWAQGRAAELLAVIPALAWRSVKLAPDAPLVEAIERLHAALAPWGIVLAPPPRAPGAEPDDTAIDAWIRKGEGDEAMRAYAAEHPAFAETLRILVAGAIEDHAEDPQAFPLWPGVVSSPV